jgi:predicted metal-dependent hydrolase
MIKKSQHPVVGEVLYKKNKRSKRVTIRIKAGGRVQVTLPTYATYQRAAEVVEQHLPWIQQQQQKAQAQAAQQQLTLESVFDIRGQQLRLQRSNQPHPQLQNSVGQLTLFLPKTWKLEEEQYQQALQKTLIEVLRTKAKAYLPTRTRYWAKHHQISIGDIRIKNVKTRWGSCSNKGNINLSLHLMLLPDALIDYVICHELAHIAHPNHSAAFWGHLETLLPGAKRLDKQLNGYQRPF